MGFFDSLLGKTTKTAAGNAATAYQGGLDQASGTLTGSKSEALGYNKQGIEQAYPALTNGYNQARSDIQSGIGTAHTALNNAGTAIKDYNTQGYGNARGAVDNAMLKLGGYFDPYIQSGQKAQGIYDNFLGVNGADAAKSAASNFAGNDPGIAYRMDMINKQNERQANASGNIGGARMALAGQRAQNEMLSKDYQDYMTRLENASARGGQYANQLGGYTMQGANMVSNLYGQEAQANASNEARHAAALQSLYTNNGINSGQLASQYGRDESNLWTNYYGNNANLASGNAAQIAQLQTLGGQNQANSYMAAAAADQQGINNMLKLGQIGVSAVTGGAGGLALGALSGLGGASGGLSPGMVTAMSNQPNLQKMAFGA